MAKTLALLWVTILTVLLLINSKAAAMAQQVKSFAPLYVYLKSKKLK